MYVFRGRQSNKKGAQAISATVLAALLSALLLLSPGTARAVASVLVENGVALPASVVRVLDALPAEPVRDALRREDENALVCTPSEATQSDEPKPTTASFVLPEPAPVVTGPAFYRFPTCRQAHISKQNVPRHRFPASRSPRAPPV